MSTGTVHEPAATHGVFDPTRTNYYCGDCRSFVQAPQNAAAMRECPTKGCARPVGFGKFQKVLRPRPGAPR